MTHTHLHYKHHLNTAPSPSLRYSPTEPAEMLQHFADAVEAFTSCPPILGEVAHEALAWVCEVWLCGQCLRIGRSVHGPHAACTLLLRPHCHTSFREKDCMLLQPSNKAHDEKSTYLRLR